MYFEILISIGVISLTFFILSRQNNTKSSYEETIKDRVITYNNRVVPVNGNEHSQNDEEDEHTDYRAFVDKNFSKVVEELKETINDPNTQTSEKNKI